jgi:pyruvate/2-oxoglutarate dehydrogenase complex dihydrolipoamide acyltransferase (E2) component
MMDVRLPDLGEVGDVRVIAWLVEVGAQVAAGDELLEVESEKATFVVEAGGGGRLVERCCAAGDTVSVDTVLGRIEADEG